MNWYSNLTGYLEITINGENTPRVINMAMSRGIRLWDIYQLDNARYILKIRLGGFRAMRHLVRRSGCRMRIRRKVGFPFWLSRAGKRKVLVLGAIFFFVVMYFLSSFVWFVEVTGNKKVGTEQILSKAAEYGLKVGASRGSVDKETVRNKLMLEIRELAWVGIIVDGTKVTIEVAEKTLVDPGEESIPADLIAGEDGVVEELLVLTGIAQVQEKDHVKKGQVLIKGLAYPRLLVNPDGTIMPDGEPSKIRARGLARGRVVRSATGQCPVREETDRDTGAETHAVILKYKDREVVLKGPPEVPYQSFRQISRVRTLFTGRNGADLVELITITYLEQRHFVQEWGLEGAYREALRRVKEKVNRGLPADCRIVDESDEPLISRDENLVQVRYTMETVEDIGTYKLK